MDGNIDMQIESDESDLGICKLTIIALTEQAQIDLKMEYPRIVKLLSRDWEDDAEPPIPAPGEEQK